MNSAESNLPLNRLKYDGITVEGYARAAVQSYWRIPELGIGFDLGGCPTSFGDTATWFISHAHLDHIAALPVYVAWRNMAGLEPPRVYLPRTAVDDASRLLAAWQQLGSVKMRCHLTGLKAGDRIKVSDDHSVVAFPTRHTVPSLGFLVWQNQSASAVKLTADVSRPLLCYVGDTAPQGLDDCAEAYQSQILITEMTFVDPRHRRKLIHKHGHLHLDDIVSRADRFANNVIVAAHLTARTTRRHAVQLVDRAMPYSLRSRFHLWT